MAALFYDPINGGVDLQVYQDPQVLTRESIEAKRDTLLSIQGLSDALRTTIAQNGLPTIGLPNFIGQADPLASFDTFVQDALDVVLDVLDYFDYDSGDAGLVVRQPTWITPDALESVSHEEVGAEGTLSIDGDFQTWWQSDTVGLRTIVWEVRGYPKKIEGLRLRTNQTDERTWLQDVTIKASENLALIDDPGNIVATGVDFQYVDNLWMEYTFPSPKFNGRYLKIEVSESLQSNSEQVRIREIEVLVGLKNHDTIQT